MSPDWSPLWLSLRVSASATAVSLILGVWIGYLIRGKRGAAGWILVPLALPPTIVCAYFLVRDLTWPIAALAALLVALPFLIRAAHTAFRAVDRHFENAARGLGASEWRVFWRVALPLAYRGILTAAAIVFARVFTECAAVLIIALHLTGRT